MLVKNKIVYVLVSEQTDHYTEMAILSIHCAREYSPNFDIELVLDRGTYNSLSDYRRQILDLVNKFHVVDFEGENNAFISRMIKTQLRSIISGNYLYIDIDAIPVRPMDNVFNTHHDIAMANDHNLPPSKFVFADYELEIFERMGWSLPKEYFNSGVMFVRDNESTHNFFKTWHSLWLKNALQKLHKDQPAMHEAIRLSNLDVLTLSPEWNVLIGMQTGRGARTPIVYHYSTVKFEERSDSHFIDIVKSIKLNKGEFDFGLVKEVIESRYPWTNQYSLRLNWSVGHYSQFIKSLFNKIL